MDTVSKQKRSEIMSRIRSKRTKPEMRMHGLLKGWRVKHQMWPDLPGHPDILIAAQATTRGRRVAVFVNGCFWHGCGEHFKAPKTNRAFWLAKIRRNQERQNETFEALGRIGMVSSVIWEHDLSRKKLGQAVHDFLGGFVV